MIQNPAIQGGGGEVVDILIKSHFESVSYFDGQKEHQKESVDAGTVIHAQTNNYVMLTNLNISEANTIVVEGGLSRVDGVSYNDNTQNYMIYFVSGSGTISHSGSSTGGGSGGP